MRRINTDILVIGGGATGTGVLRDLAMRGFKCLLVERRDLAYGTTGRYHGLLHSGARYVVKDPPAARECFEENRVLRRIMPGCIEDTGGYYVLTPHDDPDYVPQFVAGCRAAGIPVEPVPISKMLKQEPMLDPHISQCFWVPDASADSFLAANLNIESARQYGAQVLTYHEVLRLITNDIIEDEKHVVHGAVCTDLVKDEEVQIDADMVINAGGAWAGKLAGMAGIRLEMVPGKGTMLALNQRVVNTVISRCKVPSDGDILVPAHTVVVIGTTDVQVADPDHYAIEPWEIRLMLEEGEKLIPQFRQLRILRAWAGVRPLVKNVENETDRDISRAFVLMDHAERDGVDGMLTITSGKWTTYRKMAQVTVDRACEKLRVEHACRTHLETLPTHEQMKAGHHYLGARLEKSEHEASYGQLICECELATARDVEDAILTSNAVTLDDIRRDTRLGMGPCQGAYCALRAAGMLHALRHPPVIETNRALRDFLQERWKGTQPVLAGQQLRQARFNELVYMDVLNVTGLPGGEESRLAADEYTNPQEKNQAMMHGTGAGQNLRKEAAPGVAQDVVVIGAGFGGLLTCYWLAKNGCKPKVIAQGWGTPYWSSGCIDILGWLPGEHHQQIGSPKQALEDLIKTNPDHPFALAGLPALQGAVQTFLALCSSAGYPYHGTLEKNIRLPTALGTLRPTCLVPETMLAGDATQAEPMLIVGFSRYLDFYPALIADNLNDQGILAQDLTLDIKSLQQRKFVTGSVLARLFDDEEFRQELIAALKPKIGHAGRVGFPAVLGLKHPMQVKAHLENALGAPVFEIPGLPPSVPGMRLQNLLIAEIEKNGGTVSTGMQVSGVSREADTLTSIYSRTPARLLPNPGKAFVLATGGILGGGTTVDINGYAQDVIFDLPIIDPPSRSEWLNGKYFSSAGHPIFRVGVRVNQHFQPLDETRQPIFANLWAVGGALGSCDPVRERSLEGIALATGFAAAADISRKLA